MAMGAWLPKKTSSHLLIELLSLLLIVQMSYYAATIFDQHDIFKLSWQITRED
jgi:hypothetical protein